MKFPWLGAEEGLAESTAVLSEVEVAHLGFGKEL